jgi:TolB-like protein
MKFHFIFFIFICLIFTSTIASAKSVAIGYFYNAAADANFEYMEIILPNTFANSISNDFKLKTLKPSQINDILKKQKLELQKYYNPSDLPGLAEKINTDILITGEFIPLNENNIKITIYVFYKKTREILRFTTIGKIETEIFRLVDKICVKIANVIQHDNLFRNLSMPQGSGIAILTNLEPNELNSFYMEFFSKGYKISAFQATTYNDNVLSPDCTGDPIDKFKYIYTSNDFYGKISDIKKEEKLFAAAGAEKWFGEHSFFKDLYVQYDLRYVIDKNNFLNDFPEGADALLIIGFNGSRNRAWIRGIDIKNKNLFWIQSNIKGYNQVDIGEKISNILMSDPEQLPPVK